MKSADWEKTANDINLSLFRRIFDPSQKENFDPKSTDRRCGSEQFPLGILFLSHKVLRWLFPLVALGVLGLVGWNLFLGTAEVLDFLTLSAWALALTSWISLSLWPKGQHNPLQPIGYFTALNAALLLGLARYLRGVKSSVWKPTERTI